MSADLCARLRLYLVLDPSMCRLDPLEVARNALQGGATALQLRSKSLTDRETLKLAKSLVHVCADLDALFLVNDRVDIALASGASGAHLGVDDLPLPDARRLAGPDFILGYSPETDQQTQGAADAGADYLGVGPVFGTASKQDAGPAIGLDQLAGRRQISGLPTIGIGGITPQDAGDVLRTGACGVAVMSAITRSLDPEAATRELAAAISGVPS